MAGEVALHTYEITVPWVLYFAAVTGGITFLLRVKHLVTSCCPKQHTPKTEIKVAPKPTSLRVLPTQQDP